MNRSTIATATHYFQPKGWGKKKQYFKQSHYFHGQWCVWESRNDQPPTWWFVDKDFDPSTLTKLESNK